MSILLESVDLEKVLLEEVQPGGVHPVARRRLFEEFEERTTHGLLLLENGDMITDAGSLVIHINSPDAPSDIRGWKFTIRHPDSEDYEKNDFAWNDFGSVSADRMIPELLCYLAERYGFQLAEPS